jgi:hypothetical protein
MQFTRNMFHRKPFLLAKYIAVLLTLLLLTGCTLRLPSMNKLDNRAFSANLKENANANYGKKAAYYDGRIYYLSSELGQQGIYSMNTAGDGIRLEISVEDIRAISVESSGLYYAGFDSIEKNDNGPYRRFRLFQLKAGSTTPVDLLKTFSYTDNLGDENVWGFCLTKTGVFAVRFVNVTGYPPVPHYPFTCFSQGAAVPFSELTVLFNPIEVPPALKNQNHASLSSYGGLYFLSPAFIDTLRDQGQEQSIVYHFAYYDDSTGQVIPSSDRFDGSSGSYGDIFHRYFSRIEEDNIIFSSNKGLESYNMATKELTEIATFSVPNSIFQTIDLGDDILIFSQRFHGSKFLDDFADHVLRQNRALQETLFRFDPETGDISRLLFVGHNHAFLYADADTAVTGGGKTISIYDISNDKAELLRTIKVSHNIVDRANKVDTAGDWLFLYRFNEQTQHDELIEKVYIGS